MEFQGSSFFRTPWMAQWPTENRKPQEAKFPAVTGARALMPVMAVRRPSPRGELLASLSEIEEASLQIGESIPEALYTMPYC